MKKRFKFKKIAWLSLGLASAVVIPTIITSCSSTTSQKLIDKTIMKNNGLSFSSTLSLNDVIKKALKNEAGATRFANQIVGQSLWTWYNNLAKDNSISKDKALYKRTLEKKNKEIDENFSGLEANIKNNNPRGDYYLLLQQNELDLHGGTEASWKKEKQIEWAISQFKEDVFKDVYVSLVDKDGQYLKNTPDNLANVLKANGGNGGVKFAFSANYNNTTVNKDTAVIEKYAKFQEFVFNQWVQDENPFVVNSVTWNYSSMDRNTNIYTTEATGQNANASFAGTYNFPFFDNKPTNDNESVVSQFTRFVRDGSKGYVTNDTTGLRNIDKNYSTVPETYKLVTGKKEYSSDAYTGLAVNYLFSNAYNTSTSGGGGASKQTSLNTTNLTKSITTESKNGNIFDPITANFVSTNKEDFKNSVSKPITKQDSYIPYTEIQSDLVSKIIKNPEMESNGNGVMAANKAKPIYAIDAFVPNNNGLTDFIFYRNNTGVSAIAVDGLTYIKNAKTLKEAKEKAGDIILYRYLENKGDSNKSFPIDLKSKLSTYLNDNFNILIYKYWMQNKTNDFIDFSWLSDSQQKLMNSLVEYIFIKSNYKNLENYQVAIFNAKNSLATNYGQYQASKNGLASQLPYSFVDGKDTSSSAGSGKTTNETSDFRINFGHYSLIENTKIQTDLFNNNAPSNTELFWNNPYADNGAYDTFTKNVDNFVDSSSLGPLQSNFEGFKYSQYIYSNNYYVNQALLAYGDDGNDLGNSYKIDAVFKDIDSKNSGLLSKVNGDYKLDDFKLKTGFNLNNKDVTNDINSALSNYFFNQAFDSSGSKWVTLDKKISETFNSNGSMGTITTADGTTPPYPKIKYTELDDFRLQSWLSNNYASSSTANSNYLNFLTIVATMQYLLEDNGTRFISELHNKLATNDSTFIVWESGIDKSFDTTSSINSSKQLLYGDDGLSIISNLNNNQMTAYYPNSLLGVTSNTSVNTNTQNSTFTSTANYYVHASSMNGFQGFVSKDSSTNISSPLKNILFDNPKTYNDSEVGLLYGIASSRTDFENKVNALTFTSQVDELARKILVYYNIDELKDVLSATDIATKKQNLIKAIKKEKPSTDSKVEISNKENGGATQNNYVIPDDVFKPRNGYIENNKANGTDGNSKLYKDENLITSQVQYGAYVIQVNSDNLKDLSTFADYLTTTFNEKKPSMENGTTPGPQNKSATMDDGSKNAYNLIANLLVSVATSSTIQNEALNKIAEANKTDVFDKRIHNQLGDKWVANFKEQN